MRKKVLFLILIFISFFIFIGCPFVKGSFSSYSMSIGNSWTKVDFSEVDNYCFGQIDQILLSSDGNTVLIKPKFSDSYCRCNIIKSENGGQNWQILSLDNEYFKYASSADCSIIYALPWGSLQENSQYIYKIYKSTDKGVSFKPIFSTPYRLSNIYCSSYGNTIIVESYDYDYDYLTNTSTYDIHYYLSIDGINFSEINSISSDKICLNIKVSSDGNIILVDRYYSLNKGESWDTIDSTDEVFKEVEITADNSKIYAITCSGKLICSQDNFQTFTTLYTFTNTRLEDLEISGDGAYIYITDFSGNIYKSNNYGTTFQTLSNFKNKDFADIKCCYDGSKVFISLLSNKFQTLTLYKSEDYLANISACHLRSKREFSYSLVSDDLNKILLLNSGCNSLFSEDGGKNFVELNNSDFLSISDVEADSNLSTILLLNNRSIYISKDLAINWQILSPGGKNFWNDIDISSDGKTIVALNDNEIYLSLDGGTNFENITFTNDIFKQCKISYPGDYIVIISSNSIYVYNISKKTFVNTFIQLSNEYLPIIKISKNSKSIVIFLNSFCSSNEFYFSNDYGKTWKSDWPKRNNGIKCLDISSDGDFFVFVEEYIYGMSSSGGYIHRYFNNLTENEVFYDYPQIIPGACAISNDNNTCFIIGKSSVYSSKDKGKSWQEKELSSINFFVSEEFPDVLYFGISNDNKKLVVIKKDCLFISNK
jgi:photosystem II stability/assembly factor-like uncharacterized protein